MSDVINGAVDALSQKITRFDVSAKFVIDGEGSIIINEEGVREGDEDTEVTLTASRDVFEGILAGNINPTTAFMTGKLRLDGLMGTAMRLASAMS